MIQFIINIPLIIIKSFRFMLSCASAAETETHGLFHKAQTALPNRFLLQQMGHPQPLKPIKTDNKSADAFVKTWDMRLLWLKDCLVH